MKTFVRDTKAAQSISAYVVINKKGVHVATVNAHFADSGRVTVDVWNHTDAAIWSTYCTARQTGAITEKQWLAAIDSAPAYYLGQDAREKYAAFQLFGLQQGRAGGYGYDKFTAAIAGIIIDGHTIANSCGQVPEDEKARVVLLKRYEKYRDFVQANNCAPNDKPITWQVWGKQADKIGASFNNYNSEKGGYQSLYFIDGLRRLEKLGYSVIGAI